MVKEMKLREGYKKTEVGVIPEEWDTVVIDEICYIRRGASPRPIESFVTDKSNGVNWIKIGDVNKYGKINKTAQKIIQEGEAKSVPVKTGDLLLSNSMSFGKPYILEIDGCIHDGWLAISEKEDIINKKYLFYYLMSQNAKDFFDKMSAGSGVKNLNKAIVSKLVVSLPNKKEQNLISQALTEIDDLIDSIENLIDKKEKIKQGTMQELLTGKKRLDGFSGEWEVKKLGEIGDIVTGNTPPTSDADNYGGDFLFVGPGDLGINKYVKNTEKRLSKKGYALARKYPANSILVTCIGSTIGKIGVAYEELSSNQQINSIIPNNTYSSDFMYYALSNISHKIKAAASEQAVPIINKSTFGLIEILVPKLDEQQAISQILSDMDKEIEALQQKLDKYKTIKKAMMQELLTGRVRLI